MSQNRWKRVLYNFISFLYVTGKEFSVLSKVQLIQGSPREYDHEGCAVDEGCSGRGQSLGQRGQVIRHSTVG